MSQPLKVASRRLMLCFSSRVIKIQSSLKPSDWWCNHHSSCQSAFSHGDQIPPSVLYFLGLQPSTHFNWPLHRRPLTGSCCALHMWRGLSQSLCPSSPGKESSRHAEASLLGLIKMPNVTGIKFSLKRSKLEWNPNVPVLAKSKDWWLSFSVIGFCMVW